MPDYDVKLIYKACGWAFQETALGELYGELPDGTEDYADIDGLFDEGMYLDDVADALPGTLDLSFDEDGYVALLRSEDRISSWNAAGATVSEAVFRLAEYVGRDLKGPVVQPLASLAKAVMQLPGFRLMAGMRVVALGDDRSSMRRYRLAHFNEVSRDFDHIDENEGGLIDVCSGDGWITGGYHTDWYIDLADRATGGCLYALACEARGGDVMTLVTNGWQCGGENGTFGPPPPGIPFLTWAAICALREGTA